jgi:hypothetical protein
MVIYHHTVSLAEAQARGPRRPGFFLTIQLTARGDFQSLALATRFGPGARLLHRRVILTQPIFDGRP